MLRVAQITPPLLRPFFLLPIMLPKRWTTRYVAIMLHHPLRFYVTSQNTILRSFMLATKQEYAQIGFAETSSMYPQGVPCAQAMFVVHWFVIVVSLRCRLPVICHCNRDCRRTGVFFSSVVEVWQAFSAGDIKHSRYHFFTLPDYATGGLCYSASPDYASNMFVC